MRRIAFIISALVLVSCASSSASMKADVKKGNLLYNSGKYGEAGKSYEAALSERPDSGIANFNYGDALYKNRSYYGAIESYNKAIAAETARPAIISAADYNIGNATYRIGNSKEGSDLKRTKELYETALEFYKRSIDLSPSDKDAKFNYEFVEQRLKSLKDAQQKKEEKKDEKKDQKKDQQKDQDKKDQPDEGQSKGGSGGGGGKEEESDKGEDKGEDRGKDKGKESQDKGENKGQDDKGKEGEDKGNEERQGESDGQGGDAGQDKGKEGEDKGESKGREGADKGEDKGGEGQDKGKEGEEKEGSGLTAYQAPQAKEEAGEMTEQEAKMLLDGYKGEEATGKAIRMRNKPINMPEPEKDW